MADLVKHNIRSLDKKPKVVLPRLALTPGFVRTRAAR